MSDPSIKAADLESPKKAAGFRYDIHGMSTIRSNIRLKMIPDYFLTSSEGPDAKVCVEINESARTGFALEGGWQFRYHPFRGTVTEISLKMDQTKATMRFYDTLYRYTSTLRYPISQLISGLLKYALLMNGFALAHGALLRDPDGRGIAVVGLSNVGKTTTTLRLVKSGFGFLADDIFITNGDVAYCFPRPIKIENRADAELVTGHSAGFSLRKAVELLPLFPDIWKNAYYAEPRGKFEPIRSVGLDCLVFLRRGAPSTKRLSKDAALSKFVAQQRIGTIDFDLASNRIFEMYSYDTGAVTLDDLMKLESSVLAKLTSRCATYELSGEGPDFAPAVSELTQSLAGVEEKTETPPRGVSR